MPMRPPRCNPRATTKAPENLMAESAPSASATIAFRALIVRGARVNPLFGRHRACPEVGTFHMTAGRVPAVQLM